MRLFKDFFTKEKGEKSELLKRNNREGLLSESDRSFELSGGREQGVGLSYENLQESIQSNPRHNTLSKSQNNTQKGPQNSTLKNPQEGYPADSFYLFTINSAKIESEIMRGQNEQKAQKEKLISDNQRKCSDMLLTKLNENAASLSIALVREMHRILMNGVLSEKEITHFGEPGQFRETECEILVSGTDAGSIGKELLELIEEVTNLAVYSSGDALREAAYLHAELIEIYPFAYGNEIVARSLLNYYLMMNGHPPVVIFWEDRERYFKTLADYCNDGSLEALVEFLKWQMCKMKSRAAC